MSRDVTVRQRQERSRSGTQANTRHRAVRHCGCQGFFGDRAAKLANFRVRHCRGESVVDEWNLLRAHDSRPQLELVQPNLGKELWHLAQIGVDNGAESWRSVPIVPMERAATGRIC